MLAGHFYNQMKMMSAHEQSGDRFVVKVKISGYSAARFFFEHLIVKLPNEEVGYFLKFAKLYCGVKYKHQVSNLCHPYDQQPVLEAKATGVWLDKIYRPQRIPAEFKSKLIQFIRREEYS